MAGLLLPSPGCSHPMAGLLLLCQVACSLSAANWILKAHFSFSFIQRTNWICWRFAINLPVELGHSPLITRVLAFSLEFCQEEAEFIWASKWASLGRKGAVKPLMCEV
jgi:hypothetical protein